MGGRKVNAFHEGPAPQYFSYLSMDSTEVSLRTVICEHFLDTQSLYLTYKKIAFLSSPPALADLYPSSTDLV